MKKLLRKKLLRSIRTKMIAVFMMTTVLTGITALFIIRTSDNLIQKMDDMFSANVQIEEFVSSMESVNTHLNNYLVTDDSDSVLNYHKQKDIFSAKAQSMFDESREVYTADDLIYKDILYMVRSYLGEADAAVEARRMNDADEYIARYVEANRIMGYIKKYADRLNLSNLDVNTHQYLGMSDDLNMLLTTNIILIVAVIVLNSIVIFYMTYNLTNPIKKLAHSAEEMRKGNFDTDDVAVFSQDEISVMAVAFNAMKHSIKEYINELHDKADTEAKLFEQQIENLEMQALLDDAELKALQMQINPHFLFNTLNAGMQLAMIEGADRTSGFLDDIAKIFRYNVKSLSRVVKIKEEIDMVRAYSNLFRIRFGDTIQFEYDIDCSLLDMEVPPLIIQPFVENATIHGFGNMEEGGVVKISLTRRNSGAFIGIEDNGEGMSQKTIDKILNCHRFQSEKSGHTTGIGIYNVIQRLKLFFSVDDVIEIKSKLGEGTSIYLKIPGKAGRDERRKGTEYV